MTTNQNKQISNNCVFDLIVEHELGFIEATLLTNVIADANNGRSRMVGEIAANYYQLLNYCEEFNYSRRGYTSKPTALAFVNELRKTYGMTNNQAQLCTLIVSWDDANDLAEMVDFIEHHSMVGKGAFDRNAPLGAVWRYCIEYNLPYFAGVVINDLMDTRTDLLEYKTAISNFENL
ncbi:MAG: hypothetical protein K8953_13245, partial [Proteobacteria bacterium]|nr:hypothetical protein [Pseudomonadota bacterium]